MAEIKQITFLNPYSPADVPRQSEDMQRFISDELKKIEFPLNQLVNDWQPNYSLILIDATTPTTWTNVITALGNYTTVAASSEVYSTNAIVDLVAGTITLGGDPADTYLIKAGGNVLASRISGDNNTSALLFVSDGTTDHTLDATFASNSTDFISLSGQKFISVAGNTVLSLGVQYLNTAQVIIDSSSFTLEIAGIVVQ